MFTTLRGLFRLRILLSFSAAIREQEGKGKIAQRRRWMADRSGASFLQQALVGLVLNKPLHKANVCRNKGQYSKYLTVN